MSDDDKYVVEEVGMSDLHARVEKLERKVKILETTLQFFFSSSYSVPEPDEPINRNYP